MAYKKKYAVMALVGVCAASGVAWWFQNKPVSNGGTAPSAAATAPGAAAGPAKAPAVEVAKVETMRLVDETQAVGR